MSRQNRMRNGQQDGEVPKVVSEVDDEEGTVDEKIKHRILDARERVDDREDILFTMPVVDPSIELNKQQALTAWGSTVRQFIRAIMPLLRSDDLPNVTYYKEEVELGEVTLDPPSIDGYDFGKFSHPAFSETQVKRSMNLPPGFEPPKSRTTYFHGLESLLRVDRVEETWAVDVSEGPAPDPKVVTETEPIPKHIFEAGIEAADMFLQEAGIGLNIGTGRKQSNYSE